MQIRPLDEKSMDLAKKRWMSVAKPLFSLGKLEKAVIQIAGILGTDYYELKKKGLIIMCADNGVVEEGVTQTGQDVTAAVADNFTKGQASTCIMAQVANVDVFPVDIGMVCDVASVTKPADKVAYGTANLAQSWGGSLLSSGGGFIGGVVSGVSTFVIGLIFSFYILLQKEKLSRQGRQVLYGLLPMRRADRALEVLRLANRTFSSFLSGQCTEAVILGTLFVITMTLFRLPYAVLVGVLIALTALIPIVGAFIGCGVGALLIAVTDPWKALVFVILFLVLQQIEGNLIYPHVVGSSVGLPSIWVLAAVTLGGKLMGVAGMLFFIPLCSVLYALFRDFVKGRLAEKQVPAKKWRDTPPQK